MKSTIIFCPECVYLSQPVAIPSLELSAKNSMIRHLSKDFNWRHLKSNGT